VAGRGAELAAVDVQAAELGAAVELREDLAGVEDLGRVEGALQALLLVQVVLVEHHRHQVALLDPTPCSPVSTRPGRRKAARSPLRATRTGMRVNGKAALGGAVARPQRLR